MPRLRLAEPSQAGRRSGSRGFPNVSPGVRGRCISSTCTQIPDGWIGHLREPSSNQGKSQDFTVIYFHANSQCATNRGLACLKFPSTGAHLLSLLSFLARLEFIQWVLGRLCLAHHSTQTTGPTCSWCFYVPGIHKTCNGRLLKNESWQTCQLISALAGRLYTRYYQVAQVEDQYVGHHVDHIRCYVFPFFLREPCQLSCLHGYHYVGRR
jgi:hypothetical protein